MGRSLKLMFSAAVALTGVATLLPVGVASAALPTAPSVDISSRSAALAAYKTYYLPAVAVASGSTGNSATCAPGTISAAASDATLTTINYFRSMVKVAPATANATWSSNAQAAAVMMAANSSLSHTPPTTWKCYTAVGATTAGRSNLAMGYSTTGASIGGYLDDSGNAGTLGHRRWVLTPGVTTVGVGQVGSYNALKVQDGSLPAVPAGSPAYIAWPAAGYVPRALIPTENTWSFSPSDYSVDMSKSTVSVTSGGVAVATTVTHLANNYGMPAVEFTPGTRFGGGADKAYKITVSGMAKAGVALPAYTYTTTVFDQTYATSPQSITWTAPATGFKGATATMAATVTSGLPVTFSSATPTICTVSGAVVSYLAEGSCTITASQAGNTTWAATSTSRTILVGLSTKKAQTITLSAPTGAVNDGTSTLTGTASSALAVSYTSGTPAVCTVSGNLVSYVNVGTCKITANQAGNATYNAAAAVTISYAVGGLADNTINWSVTSTTVTVGQSVPLNATATSGPSVSYSASMNAMGVCSFSGGNLVFGAKGTCTVTVTAAATSSYKSASLTKIFTVS